MGDGTINAGGDTALIRAARLGDCKTVKKLIESGNAVIEYANKVGHRALHEAALSGCAECVQLLLAAGAAVDALKHADWTALHLACTKDSLAVVRALVEAGANIHLRNKDGWNCFHVACKQGSEAVCGYLLERDGRLWASTARNGRTPLMTAALHGHLPIIKMIVSHGGGEMIDTQDTCGATPLHSAVIGGHAEVARWLVEAGADVWRADGGGRTILHTAAQAGDGGVFFSTTTECAEATLSYLIGLMGPRGLAHTDNRGSTPLHLAAAENHPGSVRLLITQGASVNAVDKCRRTPLHLACSFGRSDNARLLLAAGADSAITDYQGKTPLDLARNDAIKAILADARRNDVVMQS